LPGAVGLPKLEATEGASSSPREASRETQQDPGEELQRLLDRPTPEERRVDDLLSHYRPASAKDQDAAFKTALPDTAYRAEGGAVLPDDSQSSTKESPPAESPKIPVGPRSGLLAAPRSSLSPEEEERIDQILNSDVQRRDEEPVQRKLGTGFYPSVSQMARDAQICAQLAELVPADRIANITDLVPVQLVPGPDDDQGSPSNPLTGRELNPKGKTGYNTSSGRQRAPAAIQSEASRKRSKPVQSPKTAGSQRPTLSIASSQTTVRLGPPSLSEIGRAHWARHSKGLASAAEGTELNLNIPKINGMPDWIREERADQIVAAHLRALDACLQDMQHDELEDYLAKRGRDDSGAPLAAPVRSLTADELRPLILDFYMTPSNFGISPQVSGPETSLADSLKEEDRERLAELLQKTREQTLSLLETAEETGVAALFGTWDTKQQPHPETILESMLVQEGDEGALELREFESRIREEQLSLERHCAALDSSLPQNEREVLEEADKHIARVGEGPPALPERAAHPRAILPQGPAPSGASPGLAELRVRPHTPKRLPQISE